VADSVSLLAVFLGKDLGGCDTTNESWRRGKDLVGKSAEYVGFVGGELDWGRSLFHFRRSVIRQTKGRSPLMRDGAIAYH
jgi:hypothetical protein